MKGIERTPGTKTELVLHMPKTPDLVKPTPKSEQRFSIFGGSP
jgi:hypothetical protein